MFPLMQLTEAVDDDGVRDVLLSDEEMEILMAIGYRGVPHRETQSSIGTIIQ